MKIYISKATQQICIFAYLTSFQDCSFYCHKKMWSILESHKIKMAEQNRGLAYFREYIGRGKARALMEAIEDVRMRREEGQGSSSPPIQQGRAQAPNLTRSLVEKCPGGLSTWLVRGRGLPLHLNQMEEAGVELCLLHLPHPLKIIYLLCEWGDSNM